MKGSKLNKFKHLWKAQKGLCNYCGVKMGKAKWMKIKRPFGATFDHVIPKSAGGNNSIDNLVLACASCNHKRGTQDARLFALAVMETRGTA